MKTAEKVTHTVPWEVGTGWSQTTGDCFWIKDAKESEIEANVRLIKAAPDMLEALRRVWDSRWEPDKWELDVSNALEKATGQPHPFHIRKAKGDL